MYLEEEGGGAGAVYLAGKAKKGSKKCATVKECSFQVSSIMYRHGITWASEAKWSERWTVLFVLGIPEFKSWATLVKQPTGSLPTSWGFTKQTMGLLSTNFTSAAIVLESENNSYTCKLLL